MRNDHDEIDLSQQRASRLPGVLVIAAALGVALIASWIFTPTLISKGTAVTAGFFSKVKPSPPTPDQPAAPPAASAPSLASARPVPAVPPRQPQPETTATVPTAAASTDDQATPAATPGPAVASGTATPWPGSRGIQAEANAATADTMQVAMPPQDTSAEPVDNVPLPRKRPSRLIEASLAIP